MIKGKRFDIVFELEKFKRSILVLKYRLAVINSKKFESIAAFFCEKNSLEESPVGWFVKK